MKSTIESHVQRLEEKKALLDTYRPLDSALVANLDRWLTVELSYNSTALEGNTLTKQETALVIEKGITVAGKSLREHLEVQNYAIALDFIKELAQTKRSDITLNAILDIHRIILQSIDDRNAGKLRHIAVYISGSDARIPTPLQIPDLMHTFINWLSSTTENVLYIAADAHFKLVAIHPFVDGNGRTARLLMSLILIQAGYPPAIIKNENRATYISSLEHAHTTGDLKPFYTFILNAIEESLDAYLHAAQQTIKNNC